MARLTFEEYKHQIEVIKSMPTLAAMCDEISIFATSNEPQIVALITLSEALLENHSVDESSSGETYDSLDAAYSQFKEDQVPQIIFDLINYEIDEFYQKEAESYSKALPATKSSTPYPQPFLTFSSSLSEDELKRIEKRLIEEKCIEVKSENDFVYAFSAKPIAEPQRISWLKTYCGRTDNISLAVLIHHIALEESSEYFQGVADKVYQLFDLPGVKPSDKRTFYNAHYSVRKDYYTGSKTTQLIYTILYPS